MASEGFEPSRPYGHLLLRQARLPFRHKAKLRVESLKTSLSLLHPEQPSNLRQQGVALFRDYRTNPA